MGIQGLLPFLKKIHTPVNIGQFHGSTVAVDAYCWLHKGAFSCAEKLALGEKTDQYVYYCLKYIEFMQKKNLKVIMVFDGCHLESKASVEKTRKERRDSNRKKAAQFLREGKRSEAKECLQRCVDITPHMALELMNACRARGVDCIVAPYEADAQLAFLNISGIAQIIVTEDSDLLLFGCEKVIFKMDFHGNGTLIEKRRLNEVMGVQPDFYTFDKFRFMCILSGCDYLASISGIGLAKANKVFKTARQADVKQVLKKLPTYLKTNVTVSNEYIEGFMRANNTFLYQMVYDPLSRSMKRLHTCPSELKDEDLGYAGKFLKQEMAYQIALGNIDIHTGEVIGHFDPDRTNHRTGSVSPQSRHLLSIWDKRYGKATGSPCKEIQTSVNNNPGSDKVLDDKRKDLIINTDSLKKRLVNKQKVNQEPVITEGEMAAIYTKENEMEQKRKSFMDACNTSVSSHESNDIGYGDDSSKESDEEKNIDLSHAQRKLRLANETFQYTAANIGEEAFKNDCDDRGKENKTAARDAKHRNIFAISKGNSGKSTEKSPGVMVKSWYFSSQRQSLPTGRKMSPVKLSSEGKFQLSPLLKKKNRPTSSSSNIQLLFEKSEKISEEKNKACENESLVKSDVSAFSEKLDIPLDGTKVNTDVDNEEKNNRCTKMDGAKSKKSTSLQFKLSAFSWSKSKSSQLNDSGKKESLKLSDEFKSQKSPTDFQRKGHETKRKFCIESSASFMESLPKSRKFSNTILSSQERKSPLIDSPENSGQEENSVQELKQQSYEGFLKTLGDNSFTKLQDEPKSSNLISCLSSVSVVERPYEMEHVKSLSHNTFSIKPADVIDLSKDISSSAKPTCRVSGLSKSRSKQKSLDSQQSRIQDFFSKYSFERKNTKYLQAATKNVEEDNHEDISCTPISVETSPDFSHVKRKLSL